MLKYFLLSASRAVLALGVLGAAVFLLGELGRSPSEEFSSILEGQSAVTLVLQRLLRSLLTIAVVMAPAVGAVVLYGALALRGTSYARVFRIAIIAGWSSPIFVTGILLLWASLALTGEPTGWLAFLWWLIPPVAGVCFMTTVLMQLAGRPAPDTVGLPWRFAWRQSWRQTTATVHAYYTLLAALLLVWLFVVEPAWGVSGLAGFAIESALFYPSGLRAATVAIGGLCIVGHLVVNFAAIWADARRRKHGGEAPEEEVTHPVEPEDDGQSAAVLGRLPAQIRRYPALAMLLGLLGLAIALTIFADVIVPHDPLRGNVDARLFPPFLLSSEYGEGSAKYLLGTDRVGRDLMSRLIHGVGTTLRNAVIPVFCAWALGTTAGILAGYGRGWVPAIAAWLEDAVAYFPAYLMMLLLIGVTGLGPWPWFTALILLLYPHYVRPARLATVSARARGGNVMPDALRGAIVPTTVGVGLAIVVTTAANFLGKGIPPPTAELGLMVADGRSLIVGGWWVFLFPALAIIAVLLCVNLIGDWACRCANVVSTGRERNHGQGNSHRKELE